MREHALLWAAVGGFLLVAVVVIVMGTTGSGPRSTDAAHSPAGAGGGAAPVVERTAPPFERVDAATGKLLTNGDFAGRNLLLFFSEGVACQACMVQVAELEREARALDRRDTALVSVSVDSADSLRAAARQYGIRRTPLIADEDRGMSIDYDMLGKGGMGHGDRDGHAFVLIGPTGKILWEKAYSEMYVEPARLLSDMPSVGATARR